MKAELLTCCFRSRFTLNDVLSALEEDQLDNSKFEEDEIEVAVLPPDEGQDGITDEDSDIFDDEATGAFVHLPCRILNAEAETPSLACTSAPKSEAQQKHISLACTSAPKSEAQKQPAKKKEGAKKLG